MQAVILADRQGLELAPLCDNSCPALLPVVNKPVLEYTLEDLADAGVKEILLVVSSHAERFKEAFGNGELWGVSIHYLHSRGEESPQQLLARFRSRLKPAFVAVRGDILRAPCCADFLQRADAIEGPIINARIDGQSAGLSLVREWPTNLDALAWPQLPLAEKSSHVDLHAVLLGKLSNLAEFHLTSLSLLYNTPKEIQLAGHEEQAGMRVGCLSEVDTRSHRSGQVNVGKKSTIHRTAELTGPCVIGDNCYLDRGVSIDNSVVLPGTYIGENLQVKNAIVAGDNLIRIDMSTRMPVPDPTLLVDMDSEVSSMVAQWPESLIAGFLLVASLPLWPAALLMSIVKSAHKPWHYQYVVSNRFTHDIEGRRRRVAKAWRFATSIPLLRNLPLLFLVLRGNLRLFGSAPLSPQRLHGPKTQWDLRHDMPAAGLLGPAQLLLPHDAPEEEVRLTEIEFINTRGVGSLIRRLIHASRLLFSVRSWLPAQPLA